MRVLEIKPNEEPEVVDWRDQPDLTAAIHEFVGGWFTTALRDGRIIAYRHDDGLREGLFLNFIRWDGSPIVGPVVFMGLQPDGEARGLTEGELAYLKHKVWKGGQAILLDETGDTILHPVRIYNPKG